MFFHCGRYGMRRAAELQTFPGIYPVGNSSAMLGNVVAPKRERFMHAGSKTWWNVTYYQEIYVSIFFTYDIVPCVMFNGPFMPSLWRALGEGKEGKK